MSSFICSPRHFNSIEWNLRELITKRDFYLPYTLRKQFPVLDDRNAREAIVYAEVRNIVDCWRRLNVLCVSLQYAHHHEGTLNKEIEEQTEFLLSERKVSPKVLTVRGLYNALRCLNYQIEVEHLGELRGLNAEEEKMYAFLGSLLDGLAHHILAKMSDDTSNTWSIE